MTRGSATEKLKAQLEAELKEVRRRMRSAEREIEALSEAMTSRGAAVLPVIRLCVLCVPTCNV